MTTIFPSNPRVNNRISEPKLNTLSFDGRLLSRGFWLYVWQVTTVDQQVLLYVGRTGDSSSLNAQSPYARMGQHLLGNGSANMLRRHLERNRIDPNLCANFRLTSYGPILPELKEKDAHYANRDIVAALEKALSERLRQAGYNVMNTVKCRKAIDDMLWKRAEEAFAGVFEKLRG